MLSWQTLRTAYEQEQRNQVIDWLFSFSWMFLESRILSNERTLSLSVSLSLSLSLSLSNTHMHTYTHSLYLCLSNTQTHTHTHTHCLSISQTQTCTHSLSLSNTHIHTYRHTLSLSLFKFPMLILILIFRLSLFLTMKPLFTWLECLVPHRIQVRGNRLRTLYPLTAVRTTFPAHSTMLLRMLC